MFFPIISKLAIGFFGEKLSSSNEYPLFFVPPKLLGAVKGSCVNLSGVSFKRCQVLNIVTLVTGMPWD